MTESKSDESPSFDTKVDKSIGFAPFEKRRTIATAALRVLGFRSNRLLSVFDISARANQMGIGSTGSGNLASIKV